MLIIFPSDSTQWPCKQFYRLIHTNSFLKHLQKIWQNILSVHFECNTHWKCIRLFLSSAVSRSTWKHISRPETHFWKEHFLCTSCPHGIWLQLNEFSPLISDKQSGVGRGCVLCLRLVPILEVRSRNYPLSCSSYSLWVLSKEEGALPLKHYGALCSLERFCTSVLHSAWKLSVKSVFSQGLLF